MSTGQAHASQGDARYPGNPDGFQAQEVDGVWRWKAIAPMIRGDDMREGTLSNTSNGVHSWSASGLREAPYLQQSPRPSDFS